MPEGPTTGPMPGPTLEILVTAADSEVIKSSPAKDRPMATMAKHRA